MRPCRLELAAPIFSFLRDFIHPVPTATGDIEAALIVGRQHASALALAFPELAVSLPRR